MERLVSVHLDAQVIDPCDVVLSVAVALGPPSIEETLTVTIDGEPLTLLEVAAPHGARLHVCDFVPSGRLLIDYRATVVGEAEPEPASEIDRVTYLRPSRYCESDRLGAFARAQFAGVEGRVLVAAIASWVGLNVGYVLGSSRPIDGAVATLLARRGVCRDFGHLVVALLRACDVPARLAAVYAPGLSPMDFHAVAEAYLDGEWFAIDATCLAPRQSLVRIATGRDAADTAFLTNNRGSLSLLGIQVTAVVNPELPIDDVTRLVSLR
jgi:transglutaminase-like putative cysteine protease